MRYRKITPYLFILPMVAGLVFFRYYPIVSVAVNSFRRWQMPAPPYWLGTGNYLEMFGSDQFWLVVRNTLVFVGLYVPGVVIGAFLWDVNIATLDEYENSFGQMRTFNIRDKLAEAVVRERYGEWR